MKDIIKAIADLKDLSSLQPASKEQIEEAQKALGLSFAQDYIRYVSEYGVISARGIEMTGVTVHKRLSVVEVTKKERDLNPNIPDNMYVIENIAIDGMLALQDETGKVYTITPNGEPKAVFNSLAEYVENADF